MDKGQRLAAVIAEFLFDDKGGRHLVALVKVAVGDKAVQLGAQGDGLDERRGDDVEHGVGEQFFSLVFLLEVFVDRGQIHPQADVCLIIAAVGVNDTRNIVQGIQLPQQPAVPAVAPAALILL